MFDLELLFTPDETAPQPGGGPMAPAFLQSAHEFRPASEPEPVAEPEPERPFAIPSPAGLAELIAQHYDEAELYELICALLRPVTPQPEEEPEPETPQADECSAEPAAELELVNPQGRRMAVMLPDGFSLLMVTPTKEPAPLEGQDRFWYHQQAAAYLGCGRNHLQLMLSRAREDQPKALGWRFINEDRTRCIERPQSSGCWVVIEPPELAL